MKRWSFAVIAASCSLTVCMLAAAQGTKQQVQTKSAASQPNPAAQPSEGEKRFRTNCGRCHNPPDSISPREARAVVRHMRVRAMLTTEDETFILTYLAP